MAPLDFITVDYPYRSPRLAIIYQGCLGDGYGTILFDPFQEELQSRGMISSDREMIKV